MKRLFLAVAASIALLGAGGALAQSHGGGMHGGGGGNWHGGGGGNWHGGGFHGHGHGFNHFGLFVGLPGFYWPAYYGYGYYPYGYYPYGYYYPSYGSGYYGAYDDPDSVTYIQRDGEDSAAPAAAAPAPRRQGGYSFYCTNPAGYYPQVQDCPTGWLRVLPGGSPGPRPQ